MIQLFKKNGLTRAFSQVNSSVGSYKYTIVPITYEHRNIK